MKRRDFLVVAFSLLASATSSSAWSQSFSANPIDWTTQLKGSIPLPEIMKIGQDYLVKNTQESHPKQLMKLIIHHQQLSMEKIKMTLSKQIKSEFENGKMIDTKGWFVSQTEARICAFIYLSVS